MKILWLSLCAGWLLTAVPCRAQLPASEPKPLLLVYVAKYGDNALPRIALGLEKPTVTIAGFEKCVRLSTLNSKIGGLAAQLKPDDAKAIVAAMKSLGAPDAHELPAVVLWFTTWDNKVLNAMSTVNSSTEPNLVHGGILEFDGDSEAVTVEYLTRKLQPQ